MKSDKKKAHLHIFTSRNQVFKSFLELLRDNKNLNKNYVHKIFVLKIIWEKYYKDTFPNFPENIEVFVCDSALSISRKTVEERKNADKVFVHHFPKYYSILLTLVLAKLIEKTYWVIWGGGLYYHKTQKSKIAKQSGLKKLLFSLKLSNFELLRRHAIKRVPYVICEMEEEVEQLRARYKTNATHLKGYYPSVSDYSELDTYFVNHSNSKFINIMVGVSGSSTNYHIDTLNALTETEQNIDTIVCPLSVSGSDEYVQSVIDYGNKSFGDRFKPVLDYMNPDQYGKLLSGVDIAIVNTKRQRGLGTIRMLLYLGKKVYMRSETQMYKFFERNNFQVFDSSEILNDRVSFEALDKKSAENNRSLIKELYSNERVVKLWDNIING